MTSSQTEVVIDTNVAVVENGKTEQAGPSCILNCVARLRQVQNESRVLLDDKNLILTEYRTFSASPVSLDLVTLSSSGCLITKPTLSTVEELP